MNVSATRIVDAPVERVYAALADWERQSEWIPFTRVRILSGDGGPGTMVSAVTGVGPARLVDLIRVESLDPPHELRVLHCGRVLRGPGIFRCTPTADHRTIVYWGEALEPARLWRLLRPVADSSLRLGLSRLARYLEN